MEELLEFLIEKCLNGLEEAEKKCVHTKLKDELGEIRKALESRKDMIVSSPSPSKTKDELYDLISMLTDITISHTHRARIFCVPFQIRSRRQTHKNIREIRTYLEKLGPIVKTADSSSNGKKEEDGPSGTFSRRRISKILLRLRLLSGQGTKEKSSNRNGGFASAEPTGGENQEHSSLSSGGKEFCSGPTDLPEIEPKTIQGFDGMIEKIERLLDFKNRSGHVEIGILGMCGSGKTTLAQRIYSHSSVAKDFKPRIWVRLRHTPAASTRRPFKQILRVILEQCDEEETSGTDEYDIQQLLRIVRQNLLGKKYLLVLDGLWDSDIKWYFELSRALDWQYKYGDIGDDGSESAVIITTRQEEAAKTMVGISGLCRIHPLLDQDTCWSIFINKLESLKESLWDHDDELMKEIAQWPEDIVERGIKNWLGEEIAQWPEDIVERGWPKDIVKRWIENWLGEEIDKLEKEIKNQCDGLPLAAVTFAEIIPKAIILDRRRRWV